VDPERRAGGGEYPNQDGFGWTNGVALALLEQESRRSALPAGPDAAKELHSLATNATNITNATRRAPAASR
jgi:hypothetical protein